MSQTSTQSYMTYQSARWPIWAPNGQNMIILWVVFDKFAPQEFEFGASPTDSEPHGVELYNRAIAGDFGEIAAAGTTPWPPEV